MTPAEKLEHSLPDEIQTLIREIVNGRPPSRYVRIEIETTIREYVLEDSESYYSDDCDIEDGIMQWVDDYMPLGRLQGV